MYGERRNKIQTSIFSCRRPKFGNPSTGSCKEYSGEEII